MTTSGEGKGPGFRLIVLAVALLFAGMVIWAAVKGAVSWLAAVIVSALLAGVVALLFSLVTWAL